MSHQAQGGVKKFIREVKVGLTVLAFLCVAFIVVAYNRFSRDDELPPAIINAAKSGAGEGRATILRSEHPGDYVESPSPLEFHPAQIRRPSDEPQPGTFSPPPQPRSFLPQAEFVEPPQVTPVPEYEGGFNAPPLPEQRPRDEFRPLNSPAGGDFRFDVSGDEPAAYITPVAEYHDDVEEVAPSEPSSPRTIQVLRTDSFWLISERAYGTGAYFRALYEHNRLRFPEPDRLPEGAVADTPELSELRTRYPALCPDF